MTGAKAKLSDEEILDFHMRMTLQGLQSHPDVDLVVWSETMMPPLNPDAAAFWESLQIPQANKMARQWLEADRELTELSRQKNVSLSIGGRYEASHSSPPMITSFPKTSATAHIGTRQPAVGPRSDTTKSIWSHLENTYRSEAGFRRSIGCFCH